jgi:hypothetical protein
MEPMPNAEVDLIGFSLLDDRRIYVKSMYNMDIIGMYRSLRDMTIILGLKSILEELDLLSDQPFFNVEALHHAYYQVLSGAEEVEFSCRTDPGSIITKEGGFVKKKVDMLLNDLQVIMGKILNADYDGTPVAKLINVAEQHRNMLPNVNDPKMDNTIQLDDADG